MKELSRECSETNKQKDIFMKFIVSSTLLLSHLQTISRVINSKNSMAILDNFLFRLEGTRLSMTASDQETTMTTAIDVMEAEGEGVFAVNAKILLEPLKELPDQPLTFEIDDNNLEIFLYFQNGRYNFIGVNGDEYPTKMPMVLLRYRFLSKLNNYLTV